MKKKILIFLAVMAILAFIFALGISAAEPSTSDDFGEVTLITGNDALDNKADYGYSEGDTARIVLQVPGTNTYMTYPMYYCFGVRNDGKWGMQPVPDFTQLKAASGIEYSITDVIRLEIPGYFTAISTNYTSSNQMTSLKYIKFNKNFIYLHSSALANLTALETVVFENNESDEISLEISSRTFANCTSLTSLSLPNHTTSIGERAFDGCTALETVDLSKRLTAIGTASFINCTALKTVNIPENNSITEVAHRAFENCKSLTGAYAFDYVTIIGTQAFKGCSTNEGTSLSLSFPSIVNLGGNSGDSNVFTDSGVCELSFGKNLEVMTYNTFSRCKRLWRVEFAGVAQGFEFKSYTFEDCSALKAVSLPEGITVLPSRMFKNCSSITAVYIPSTVTKIASGDNDHATFKACTNLYFVDKPFTYKSVEDIPAEPSVYYFPSGITEITGEAFDGSRLNDIVVFPEGVTSLTQGYTFEGSTSASGTPTIVFMGDMETVNIRSWGASAIYFCNSADVDCESAGATNDKRIVFCYAEGNTKHLTEKTMATDATCENPKMVADYCFCGLINGTPETDGEALGHNYTGEISYSAFADITSVGIKTICCVNGCNKPFTEEVTPLKDVGYSVKAYGNGYSFTKGYDINAGAIDAYEKQKGVSVSYGFAFNKAEGFTGEDVTPNSFMINSLLSSYDKGVRLARFEYKIKYEDDTKLDAKLIIGEYVVEKAEDGEERVVFLNKGNDNADFGGFTPISYNDVLSEKE